MQAFTTVNGPVRAAASFGTSYFVARHLSNTWFADAGSCGIIKFEKKEGSAKSVAPAAAAAASTTGGATTAPNAACYNWEHAYRMAVISADKSTCANIRLILN